MNDQHNSLGLIKNWHLPTLQPIQLAHNLSTYISLYDVYAVEVYNVYC